MSLADPWSWTVDELVEQVCHSRVLFAEVGCDPRRYPDLSHLEQQIRQHSITGTIFLGQIDDNRLQDGLNIEAPSARQAIIKVINLLRSRSRHFKQLSTTTTVGALYLGDNAASSIVPSAIDTGNPARAAPKKPKRAEVETIVIDDDPLPDNSLSRLSGLIGSHESAAEGGTGTHWNYLLGKWKESGQEDSTVLATEPASQLKTPNEGLFDDDDEEEMHSLDGSEPDREPSPVPRTLGRNQLSLDEAVAIINDSIEQYTNQWYPGKGGCPEDDLAFDAHDLWHEAESSGERQDLINRTKESVEIYEEKLNRLCKEIAELPWTNAKSVQKLCASLEVTIDLLEQEKWELSVYQMPSPPPPLEGQAEETGNDNIPTQLVQTPRRTESNNHTSPHQEPSTTQFPGTQVNDIIDLGSGSDSSDAEFFDPMPIDDDAMVIDDDPSPPQIPVIPQATPITTNSEPKPEITSATPSKLPQSTNPQSTTSPPRASPPHYPTSPKPPLLPRDSPEDASIATVSKWSWASLSAAQDRKRILMKALHSLPAADLETVRKRITDLKKKDALAELPASIAMLMRGDNRMRGVLPRDRAKILKLTNLFLCWWLADNYLEKRPEAHRLEELALCLEAGTADLDVFYDYLRYVLNHTFSEEALKNPLAPSQAEVVVISSDEEEEMEVEVEEREEVVVETPVRGKGKRALERGQACESETGKRR